MSRVFNFSAGPCTLPLPALEEARRELVDYDGTGMSIIEMSHRTPPYEKVHQRATALVRELSEVPDDFDVLLLQGGATLQFAMVPLNLLSGTSRAGFAVTGSWAERAFEDAGHHGHAFVAWSGRSEGYVRAPTSEELVIQPETRYLHITSNETIEGLRYATWPDLDVPLVADVSSEFLSRPVPWERFDLVYGGIQKNLGPAGMAVVLVRRSVVQEGPEDLASYLRYGVHAASDSMFNTPPVFQVYLMDKVLSWMKSQGGVYGMEKAAEHKASLINDAIARSDGFYRSPVAPDSRSVTNVVFRLAKEELEAEFVAEAEARGLVGLKGHRKVGGCRASLYAAMPIEGAEALAQFMDEFRSAR